jgi:hypothetical protein
MKSERIVGHPYICVGNFGNRLAKNDTNQVSEEYQHRMPLHCSSLSADALVEVRRDIDALPETHPLRANADVYVTEESGVTVFESNAQFYFRRGTAFQAIQDDIRTLRNFLCSSLEMDEDPTIPERCRVRILETVGRTYADAVETVVIRRDGKSVLLMKVPQIALYHMVAKNGGTLKTAFAGSTDMLRQIPTLSYFLRFPDAKEQVSSVFATKYAAGEYDKAMMIHNAIVREVVKHKGKGICLKWVARWEP